MSVKAGQSVAVQFTTRNRSTGAAANADGTPAGTLVKNGADQGDTVTVTNISTGVYKAAVAIPAGAAAGDIVGLRIAATVGGISDSAIIWRDNVDSKRLADLNDAAAAPSVMAIRNEIDNNSTRLADIQSRLPAALVGGRMNSNVSAIDNQAVAAVRLAISAGQLIPGTVDTATNSHTPSPTQFQAGNITEATLDHFKGRIVLWTSGPLSGQVAEIIGYTRVGGIGQFNVSTMTEPPNDDDTFLII